MAVKDNVRIGEMEVYMDYGDGSGEVFLGQTKGGVEFTFEREFEDLTVDKYGSMPLDIALTGQNLMIKATLAEMTTRAFDHAIPEGRYASTASDSKIGLGTQAGFLSSTVQGLMRLHRRGTSPSSRNEDIYIWKAVSVETIELAYKIDEQRVLEITWRALVDETRADGEHLGRIGDEGIS